MNGRDPIRLRWPARCCVCDVALPAGRQAWWDPNEGRATCCSCLRPPGGSSSPNLLSVCSANAPFGHHFDYRAGTSARGRFDRQTGNIGSPDPGALASADPPASSVHSVPAHVLSWHLGAVGEERVGELLDGLSPAQSVALHDRRFPGSQRKNIDHLVVGSRGLLSSTPNTGPVRSILGTGFSGPNEISVSTSAIVTVRSS